MIGLLLPYLFIYYLILLITSSFSLFLFLQINKIAIFPPSHLVIMTSLVELLSTFFVARNQIKFSSLPLYESQTCISPSKILYSSTASTPNFRILSLPQQVPQPLPRWDLWNASFLSTRQICWDLLITFSPRLFLEELSRQMVMWSIQEKNRLLRSGGPSHA